MIIFINIHGIFCFSESEVKNNKHMHGDCRLGLIVDFLSHATIVGFMGGAATVVCLQQLKSILGLVHFTHGADIISVMRSVFTQTHEVNNFYTEFSYLTPPTSFKIIVI